MSTSQLERIKDLQSLIELRKQQISQQESKRDELKRQMGAKPNVDGPMGLPVLIYCGPTPRKSLRNVPPEHVGNVFVQLEAAVSAFENQNRRIEAATRETADQIKLTEVQKRCVQQQIKLMHECTGQPTSRSQRREASATPFGRHSKASAAYNAGTGPTPQKETTQEIAMRNALLQKEIHDTDVLIHKKDLTIQEMKKAIAEKSEACEEINVVNNAVRCITRDIREQQLILKDLEAEQRKVDKYILDKAEADRSITHEILLNDVASLKKKTRDVKDGETRVQIRVIKAQEYRIQHLENLIAGVRTCLTSHGLIQEVEQLIGENLKSDKENSLAVPETTEDLYNVDLIIPAQEKIDVGIYSLFLAEKEKLAKVISLQNILVKEKEEVVKALITKVKSLTRNCDEAIGDLEHATYEAAVEEEEQRGEATELAIEQRERYHELLQRRKLAHERLINTKAKAKAKK